MFDFYETNLVTSRQTSSRTPAPISGKQPFFGLLNQNLSDVRDNMQRLYKVPGNSYLVPWGNEKTIGKATPRRVVNKPDLNLQVSDIDGAQTKKNKSNFIDVNRSLDEKSLALPEIRKPYFPRRHLLNEFPSETPSPERSRKMGLLEQLQNPKPVYLSTRKKYAAPNKHGKPIRLFIEEKLTPKIGSKWE